MARFTYPAGGGGGGDVSFTEEGCIVFPNDGEICNVPNSSGDGFGLSTISINPDTGTESDQYIIIDPTVPNHIHIRAGGQIDNSAADLIIGGERTHVLVTDGGRDVAISTATTQDFNSYQNLNEESSSTFITLMPAVIDSGYVVSVDWNDYTVDSVTLDSPSAGLMSVLVPGATFTPEQMYTFVGDNGVNNNWYFDSNGTFLGPIEGLVKVDGIYGQNEFPLAIIGPESVLLDGDAGEFLNDANNPLNQIATIGDIVEIPPNVISTTPSGYYGSFLSTIPQSATIINTAQPVVLDLHEELYGVTIVDDSEITIEHPGVYNLQFSAQMHNDGGGGAGQTIAIWLNKNGSAVPNSATRVTVPTNSPYTVAAWNFIERIETGGENLQLMWATDNINVLMPTYAANGIYPAVPSVILTLTQVASL